MYWLFTPKIHLLNCSCVLQILLDAIYMELGKLTYLGSQNGESKLARFHVVRILLRIYIYHFPRLSCLMEQLAPYNQLLFNHFLFSQKTILNKMLKSGIWHFKPNFLRMQFSSVATVSLKFWSSELIFAS